MKDFFRQFKILIIRHSIVILVGITMATLVASPHIRALIIVGPENFEGFYPTFNDDEITYQARIKEVLDGNFGIGNPYIKERADDSFIMPPVAEWIVAGFAKITNTSVPLVMVTSDFVLAFINFLLVYTLFLLVTGNRKTLSLLNTVVFFVFSFSVMGRPISPQLNALPMFLGLIFITKIYLSEIVAKRRTHIVSGLFTGITSFFYPYFFTTLLVFWGLLTFSYMVRARSIFAQGKEIAWFMLGFAPLILLYGYFQIQASGVDFYTETISRYGLMRTHLPGSFTNTGLGLLTGGLILLSFRLLKTPEFIYAISLAVSIVALNLQNVITGVSLQLSSHYMFTAVLSILLVLALIHTALISKRADLLSRRTKFLIIIGMVCLLGIIAKNRKEEYLNIAQMPYTVAELKAQQKKMAVLNWFDENTELDSVVYTLGGDYDFLLPVYAKNKVYYNFYAALYPAGHAETEERWLIQNFFNMDMSTSTIRDKQRDYWGNRYIDSYQSSESRKKIWSFVTRTPYVPGEMVPDSQIDYMYQKWLDIQAKPIEDVFARYQIDYILLTKEYPFYQETKTRLDKMNTVSPVSSLNEGLVYKIR